MPKSKAAADLKVGDIVMIPEDGVKRSKWQKAIITEVYPSANDDVVRVVQVKTVNGTYTRAVKNMIRLEVNQDVQQSVDAKDVPSRKDRKGVSLISPPSSGECCTATEFKV